MRLDILQHLWCQFYIKEFEYCKGLLRQVLHPGIIVNFKEVFGTNYLLLLHLVEDVHVAPDVPTDHSAVLILQVRSPVLRQAVHGGDNGAGVSTYM